MKKEIKRPNLKKVIESLEKQINNISITYDCNITRRRAEQLRQNQIKQDSLKDIQAKVKALDNMWENWNVPIELKLIKTKSDVELVSNVYTRYPTEELINDSYEYRREGFIKIKKRFNKLGLHSQNKVDEARKILSKSQLVLSADEIRQRKIKDIENNIRGAKIPGFFPTPKSLIEELIELGDIRGCHEVLEPSAGKGDMVDVLKNNGIDNINCIEINHSLKSILEIKGCEIVGSDFLEFNDKKYDRIIMNPPFENLQDIDHVRKAYDTLKDGGILVSIMSASPFFRSGEKSESFRSWINSLGAVYYKNDDGAFNKAFNSTGVSTYTIKIEKKISINKEELKEKVEELIRNNNFKNDTQWRERALENIVFKSLIQIDFEKDELKKYILENGGSESTFPAVNDILATYELDYFTIEEEKI